MAALSTMSQTANSRLMGVDNGRLVGEITPKDMLTFVNLQVEFEQ